MSLYNLVFGYPAGTPQKASIINNVFKWGKSSASSKTISEGYCGTGRNAGKVVAKVLINRYCPILKGKLLNAPMIFAEDTMQSLNSDRILAFKAVPGIEGIYLSEKYYYHNNWLGNPKLGSFAPSKHDWASEKNVNHKLEQGHQRWNMVPNPVSGKQPIFISDLEGVNQTFASYEDSGLRTSETPTINEDIIDRPVWDYIFVSSKDSGPRLLMPAMATANIENGVHWKVDKETPLFEGQDFFIEFRRVAALDPSGQTTRGANVVTNISQEKQSSYQTDNGESLGRTAENEEAYYGKNLPDYINSDAEYNAGAKDSQQDLVKNSLPANWGVTSYTIDTEGSGSDLKYKFSRKGSYYNFSGQAYLMIEIGQEGTSHFFIIIAESGPIIFIKEVNGKSYRLGAYNAISGKDLLEQIKFRMTLRNHLGKIVISFSGLEDNPWIISNDTRVTGSETEQGKPIPIKEDKIFRIPDNAQLNIWGGNCQYAFSYFVLCYQPESSLFLPPSKEENYKGGTFTVSDEGIHSHYCLLSAFDEYPHALRNTQDSSGHVIYLGDQFEKTRNPFFTCDAQAIVEVGTEDAYDPFFTDTNMYIKKRQDDEKIALSVIALQRTFVNETEGLYGGYEYLESTTSGTYIETESFKLRVFLRAGDHSFESSFDPEAEILRYCKTPILTHVRLLSVPKDEPMWQADAVDVSQHVLSISDAWSSQDYVSCEHSASISFLINRGLAELPQSEYLDGLKDRAFYIEIWAGYEGCSYVTGEEDLLFKLFTGICYGGTLKQEPNKRTLECKVLDYTQILKDTLFFNSPFFDGMRDINAVNEMLEIASMRFAGEHPPEISPPAWITYTMANQDEGSCVTQGLDGRPVYYYSYALPFSYSRLQNPFLRFQDGTSIWDAITSIAKKASRMCFFDVHGAFHYENSEGIWMSQVSNEVLSDYVMWYFRSGDIEFFESGYQYIFTSFTKEGTVMDVYNNIHILTATPDRELLIGDKIDKTSLENPSVAGFLGYTKTLFQQEGYFGNEQALRAIMDHYASFFVPPLVIKCETYGQPIRAFDFMQLDGINLMVTGVSSEISPSENKWWQTIDAEYVF